MSYINKHKLVTSVYDKIASKYARLYFHDLSDTPYIDKFLSFLPKKAKILDVGCGAGNFANYMIKKGFRVEGIDLSSEMLKIARQKVPNGKFKLMDMQKLKYKNEIFNGLLSAYSLIHIPSNEMLSTLKEFYRILKPDGVILAMVQKGESDKIIDEPLKKGEKVFINLFTRKRLSDFLTKVGFKIIYQKEVVTQKPSDISDTFIYIIARKPS